MPEPNKEFNANTMEGEEQLEKEVEESLDESCSEEESGEEGDSEESSDGGEDEEEASGSEEESGSDGEEEEEDEESQDASKCSDSQVDYASDQSDGTSERCPICLGRFVGQDVGNPESCDHSFCLECIVEWSKNVNTCPVDRHVFHLILAKHSLEGTVYRRIPVADRQVLAEEEEDLTHCEICGRSDREDRMLLCDGCDMGYHMECLDPPLQDVPVQEWFCPDCEPQYPRRQRRRRSLPEDDVLLEVVQVTYIRQPNLRQIPRTLTSERVRNTIATIRANRIVSSDEEPEVEVKPRGTPSTSSGSRTTTRRKTVRKKTTKTKRRRKTKGRKTRKTTGRKRKTTTKGKRKTRKRKKKTKKVASARTAKQTPPSIKARLADRLGISKPPTGRMMPTVKGRSERTLELQRFDIGASSLSIFGSRDYLDPYPVGYDSEEEHAGSQGSTMVARPGGSAIRSRLPSKMALKSHQSLGSLVRSSRSRRVVEPVVAPSNPGFDLLGSIMMGQERLKAKSEDVTIKRDGSLEFRQEVKSSSTKGRQNAQKACDEGEGTEETSGGNGQGSNGETNTDQNMADSGNQSVDTTDAMETGDSTPTGDSQDSGEQGMGGEDSGGAPGSGGADSVSSSDCGDRLPSRTDKCKGDDDNQDSDRREDNLVSNEPESTLGNVPLGTEEGDRDCDKELSGKSKVSSEDDAASDSKDGAKESNHASYNQAMAAEGTTDQSSVSDSTGTMTDTLAGNNSTTASVVQPVPDHAEPDSSTEVPFESYQLPDVDIKMDNMFTNSQNKVDMFSPPDNKAEDMITDSECDPDDIAKTPNSENPKEKTPEYDPADVTSSPEMTPKKADESEPDKDATKVPKVESNPLSFMREIEADMNKSPAKPDPLRFVKEIAEKLVTKKTSGEDSDGWKTPETSEPGQIVESISLQSVNKTPPSSSDGKSSTQKSPAKADDAFGAYPNLYSPGVVSSESQDDGDSKHAQPVESTSSPRSPRQAKTKDDKNTDQSRDRSRSPRGKGSKRKSHDEMPEEEMSDGEVKDQDDDTEDSRRVKYKKGKKGELTVTVARTEEGEIEEHHHKKEKKKKHKSGHKRISASDFLEEENEGNSESAMSFLEEIKARQEKLWEKQACNEGDKPFTLDKSRDRSKSDRKSDRKSSRSSKDDAPSEGRRERQSHSDTIKSSKDRESGRDRERRSHRSGSRSRSSRSRSRERERSKGSHKRSRSRERSRRQSRDRSRDRSRDKSRERDSERRKRRRDRSRERDYHKKDRRDRDRDYERNYDRTRDYERDYDYGKDSRRSEERERDKESDRSRIRDKPYTPLSTDNLVERTERPVLQEKDYGGSVKMFANTLKEVVVTEHIQRKSILIDLTNEEEETMGVSRKKKLLQQERKSPASAPLPPVPQPKDKSPRSQSSEGSGEEMENSSDESSEKESRRKTIKIAPIARVDPRQEPPREPEPLPFMKELPPKPVPQPLMDVNVPLPKDDSGQPRFAPNRQLNVYDPAQPTDTESPPPNVGISTGFIRSLVPAPATNEIPFPRPQEMRQAASSEIPGLPPRNVLLQPVNIGMLPGQVRVNTPMMVNPVLMPGHPALRGMRPLPPGFAPQTSLPMMADRFPLQNGIPVQAGGPPPERLHFEHVPGLRPGMLQMPPPPLHAPPGPRIPGAEGMQIDFDHPPPGHHPGMMVAKPAEAEQLNPLMDLAQKMEHISGAQPPHGLLPQQLQHPRPGSDVFKVPLPPSGSAPGRDKPMDKTSSSDKVDLFMKPRERRKPSRFGPEKSDSNFNSPKNNAPVAEAIEVVDMDVESPVSDDDLGVSFTPPPEKSEDSYEDITKDDIPASAVELDVQSKFMKKLNRQERVVEEVKLALKPHYSKGKINKDDYKTIMRKAVPKICHSKSGDINPTRIRKYVEDYVEKMRQSKKWEAKKGGSKPTHVKKAVKT